MILCKRSKAQRLIIFYVKLYDVTDYILCGMIWVTFWYTYVYTHILSYVYIFYIFI